jgi:hypothetical protein
MKSEVFLNVFVIGSAFWTAAMVAMLNGLS